MVSLNICAGHWSGGHVASERTGDARGSCKQRTFAPAAAHQSKQTRHLHLSGAVFPSRPYNSGPTVTKLRHYSQSDHSTASTVPWRHGSTGCQSSVFFVAVTCYPGFILRHRFLKPPARTQTPLAAFGGAHGRPAGYRRWLCATCATTGGVPERARRT